MSSVDIVVPCYRYGRYLRDCVQSILTQGVEDVRVLIIDDESPDETPEVGAALAREDSRVTFRRHASNKGHIATYNEGIEWASARYMLLLSADDFLLPGALDRATSLMDRHPGIGLTIGDAVVLVDDGTRSAMKVPIPNPTNGPFAILSGPEFIGHILREGTRNFVPTPTAVVRTELQKRIGGYRADLPHSGDLELWLRFAAHGSIGYLCSEQAVYRRHTTNMSLGYVSDQILRELHQRQAALDAFVQSCRERVPEIPQLHVRLLHSLAREAIGQASIAFNRGRMDLCREITEFAVKVDPTVRSTLPWNALALKRLLGPRLSTALLPAATIARELGGKLHG